MGHFIHILHQKGFTYAWTQFLNLFHLDKNLVSLIHRSGAYRYLSHYRYVLNRPLPPSATDTPNPYPDKIWVCWLQGIENAPHIVKKCIESIKKHAADQEVILITNENLDRYLRLPEYILDKWKNNIISNTHFSDIVRVNLLNEYGGIWIDATILLSGPIPAYIKEADLFFFQGPELAKVVASNWFIAAKPHHGIIFLLKELLHEYWKRENRLRSYSIFHLFLFMVIHSTRDREEQWKQIPYIYAELSQMLQNELFNPYDSQKWQRITQFTTVHKLSYKPPKENFDRKGTLYEALFLKD